MNSKEKPFISITGISTTSEANGVARSFQDHLPADSTHQAAIGFLVNSHSLEGAYIKSIKYPDINSIPALLSQTQPDIINIIHYATQDRKTLPSQIINVYNRNDIYKAGLSKTIQLNVRWPDVADLQTIKDELPDLKIILPLTARTLNNQSREQITQKLKRYENNVDYILIDPSGGKGITFTAGWAATHYRLLKDNYPEKQIILAGGFNDKNITQRLAEISHAVLSDDFGIDAESGLREPDKLSRYGKLSLPKVDIFIKKAANFLSPTIDSSSPTATQTC